MTKPQHYRVTTNPDSQGVVRLALLNLSLLPLLQVRSRLWDFRADLLLAVRADLLSIPNFVGFLSTVRR